MGICGSRGAMFHDRFTTWDDVRASEPPRGPPAGSSACPGVSESVPVLVPPRVAGLRSSGFEDTGLILAIDNTGSNDVKGWGGKGLHDLDHWAVADGRPATPYEVVLSALGDRMLSILDRDSVVPVLGFGDSVTTTHGSGCRALGEARCIADALALYRDYVCDERIGKSGPTSFAGVIARAMDRVRETRRFHTLIILTDGAVDDEPDSGGPSPTAEAIVAAASLPLEIIAVGIGTGPVSG